MSWDPGETEAGTERDAEPERRRSPFVRRVLLAMAVGAGLGVLAHQTSGPGWDQLARFCSGLGFLGSLIVSLIKGLAGPLLFFAILDAFLRTRVRGRAAGLMFGISTTNALIAVVIGLTLSNTIRPGRFLDLSQAAEVVGDAEADQTLERFAIANRPLDFLRDLLGFVPTNPVQPFLDNSILSIVILAVLGGAALRGVKEEQLASGRDEYRIAEQGVAVSFRAIEIALGWVIATVPLAVFGVVAKTVAEEGFDPFAGLFAYVGVAMLGLALQVGIVYQTWIVLASGRSLREFWSRAKEAVVYALGASSSLATLPVTLRCLDRLKVTPTAARLSACVGTNFNNDGILLYEAMAVLFVAQAYGIDLSLGQQLIAALSCVLAGIGIAGVPEAGLISLALVLNTVGLPIEILPLLLTVDWVLSRCRAMTNVVADILVAVLLDRFGVGHEEDAIAERRADAAASDREWGPGRDGLDPARDGGSAVEAPERQRPAHPE